MTEEKRVVRQLRGVAAKLTCDAELQKDLLQEMFVHLIRVEVELPGHTPSWYIKSCEFRARNYLKHGRSVDSLKRSKNLVSFTQDADQNRDRALYRFDAVDPLDVVGEVMLRDVVQMILPHLSETQRDILFLLMKGMGVREVAREMGITHPAVIKHRRKIARIADGFVHEAKANLPATV